MAANRVIGCNNKIPWYIPGEQLLFKKITMGYPLIMGRLTWEDIGRPLPGRRNIVLSKKPDFSPFGGEHTGSLAQALQLCRQEKKSFCNRWRTDIQGIYAVCRQNYPDHSPLFYGRGYLVP